MKRKTQRSDLNSSILQKRGQLYKTLKFNSDRKMTSVHCYKKTQTFSVREAFDITFPNNDACHFLESKQRNKQKHLQHYNSITSVQTAQQQNKLSTGANYNIHYF